MKINGRHVSAREFAWDGCHKIYLINSADDRRILLEKCGYDEGDIHPIAELPRIWEASCLLRFIENADLSGRVVPQCEDAVFTEEALS